MNENNIIPFLTAEIERFKAEGEPFAVKRRQELLEYYKVNLNRPRTVENYKVMVQEEKAMHGLVDKLAQKIQNAYKSGNETARKEYATILKTLINTEEFTPAKHNMEAFGVRQATLEKELIPVLKFAIESAKRKNGKDTVSVFDEMLHKLNSTGDAYLVQKQLEQAVQEMEKAKQQQFQQVTEAVEIKAAPKPKKVSIHESQNIVHILPSDDSIPNPLREPAVKMRYVPTVMFSKGPNGYVFKGVDKSTNKTVAMKIILSPTEQDEFEIMKHMAWIQDSCGSKRETGLVCMQSIEKMPSFPFTFFGGVGKLPNEVNVLIMEDLWNHYSPIENYVGRFTDEELISLGQKLYDFITSVHNCGLVHGDINVNNVLYDRDTKTFKLIDFGSSCVVGATTERAGKCSAQTLFDREHQDFVSIGNILVTLANRAIVPKLKSFIDHCYSQRSRKYGNAFQTCQK
jgi:hypothetical protein